MRFSRSGHDISIVVATTVRGCGARRTAPPRDGEAVRWECVDGRWVSVTVGHGEDVGSVVVRDSSGRCESIDSYEDALALARQWRTVDES